MASYKAIELKILQFMFLGRNSKIETRDLFRPSKSPSKLFFSAFRPISLEHFGTVGRKGDATTIYRSARFFIRFTNNIGTPIREMDVPNGQSILETYSDPQNRPRVSFFLQVWIDLSEPLVAKWTQQQSVVFFNLNSIH